VNSQASGTNTTAVGDNAVASGNYAVALGNNATASHTDSVALGNGSVSSGANTVSVGSAAIKRRVTNVADGVSDFDAVNKRQLDDQHEKAMKGIATAMAMDVILPDPDMKFGVNVGGGFYDSESAIGITGAGRVNKDVALYFGVATDTDGDEVGAKVGAFYQW
jgi:autotransporter adhesin